MDAGKAVSDKKEGDVTPYDPFRDRTTPCDTCYCKRCCYHCQLCFLQKALGVHYHAYRNRRSRQRLLEKISEDSRVIALFLMSSRETISVPTTSNSQAKKEKKSPTQKNRVPNQTAPK
ncbi:tat protein [Simian immunodeficiency virus SIV-mnd 2]|uniref:Protein Tat n=1 Tax=Simian immunodeficiency virus SIV-mnd 2 TaxID=159122 RepID=Q8AII5_SIV|nr:tat protein [Simian immunodeficiency virus SIV-mnd 2]AAN85711.1 tat protein [Simian immunodeficiency virus SIV-mnd 2]